MSHNLPPKSPFGARNPSLYQLNTRVWLTEIRQNGAPKATLDELDLSTLPHRFDWYWFLSVWQTGETGQSISRQHPGWLQEFRRTLPDLAERDIAGSGFAVTAYNCHNDLGGNAALARIKDRVHALGSRLMLDFVPNHMAIDHPWVNEHPDYFIQGTADDIAAAPQNYIALTLDNGDQKIFAHGRDPYFDGWCDTLQLDYANPALQDAMIAILLDLADRCDGLRCDMAMLVLPEIFERTWGRASEPFWPRAIAAVKSRRPDFCFMAEVYWDLEWELQQQGFDYTYDKRLYDRLRERQVHAAREHLYAGIDYQKHMVRFLENHDEARASVIFPHEMQKAAAVISYLAPGMRFFHQGQFEGKRIKISPHLVRGPEESVDQNIRAFYAGLLEALDGEVVRNGDWRLLAGNSAWQGNFTNEDFIAYAWSAPGSDIIERLVVVNYAPHHSQCYIPIPLGNYQQNVVVLKDQLSDRIYERNAWQMRDPGLYVELGPWQAQIFKLESALQSQAQKQTVGGSNGHGR
jgi:Alpha amylase, catalytic domain